MLSKFNFMGTWVNRVWKKNYSSCCQKKQLSNDSTQLKCHSNLLKQSEITQNHIHEEVAEPRQHACWQFCAAGRWGWAQVCSFAYCSLAWVNKEKTGAIRQTCQAWNSLLVFTPFTLGLSQRCCISPYFWQGPTAICFSPLSKDEQTVPVLCDTRLTTHLAGREKLPMDMRFKELCVMKWHWDRVPPQPTRCRIKAKEYFCDHIHLRHHCRCI